MPSRFIITLFLSLALFACRKEDKILSAEGTLGFSKEEVFFDTVFTRLPGSQYPRSVNKRFMVRNPYKETVLVNVRVMGGTTSAYRINADGRTGRFIPDLEILPQDSAWVFVEATLEANNQNNPILVKDSIEFETNGKRQYVRLSAYGWDAYYLKDTVFTGTHSLTLTDKPYVIVNTAFVDKNSSLEIGPGVHIYSTPNSTISTTGGALINIGALNILGTLKIKGTVASPVVLEGDRLEDSYKDKPGQWRGLHFWRGSTNNELDYTVIKNASIGVRVDSLPESGIYGLQMRHCTVKNISAFGILGITAKLKLENTLVYNCGVNTFFAYLGGDYTINHCTFYTSGGGRRDPQMVFNNAMRDQNKVVIKTYKIGFDIRNSIIWGPLETELGFDLVSPPDADPANLSHSLVKSKVNLGGTGNLYNKDPRFEDIPKAVFKLKTDSPARDSGDPDNSLPDDLDGKTRSDGLPDMGAFEF